MKDANLTATVLVLIACVFAAGVASFANGPVPNYLTADARWDDLRFPLITSSVGPGIKPASLAKFKDNGASSDGVFGYSFAGNAENELFGTVQMPHDWNGGKADLHVHWSPTTTATTAVTLGLEYCIAKTNGTFGNTAIATISATPSGTAYKHQLNDIVAFAAADLNDSAMVHFRIFRQGDTDANNDAVFIHEIDIHYKRDRLGSAGEYGDK